MAMMASFRGLADTSKTEIVDKLDINPTGHNGTSWVSDVDVTALFGWNLL